MSHQDQQVLDRGADGGARGRAPRHRAPAARESAQRAARVSLRSQIARLEHELSQIVADRFPFIPAPARPPAQSAGPRLLDLGGLEQERDRLAGQLQECARWRPIGPTTSGAPASSSSG